MMTPDPRLDPRSVCDEISTTDGWNFAATPSIDLPPGELLPNPPFCIVALSLINQPSSPPIINAASTIPSSLPQPLLGPLPLAPGPIPVPVPGPYGPGAAF